MPCAVFCDGVVHSFDEPFPRRYRISFQTSGLLSLRSVLINKIDFGRRALYGTSKLQASFLLTLHAAGGNRSVPRPLPVQTQQRIMAPTSRPWAILKIAHRTDSWLKRTL